MSHTTRGLVVIGRDMLLMLLLGVSHAGNVVRCCWLQRWACSVWWRSSDEALLTSLEVALDVTSSLARRRPVAELVVGWVSHLLLVVVEVLVVTPATTCLWLEAPSTGRTAVRWAALALVARVARHGVGRVCSDMRARSSRVLRARRPSQVAIAVTTETTEGHLRVALLASGWRTTARCRRLRNGGRRVLGRGDSRVASGDGDGRRARLLGRAVRNCR